jgi:hypothetical protein
MFLLLVKVHRLGVGNDINPRPSEKDKRLVVVKTPNAVNPLVWGYYVSQTFSTEALYLIYYILYEAIHGKLPDYSAPSSSPVVLC